MPGTPLTNDRHRLQNTGKPMPTTGGKQFFPDVFIHAGWRLQKNVLTGAHRLLDTGKRFDDHPETSQRTGRYEVVSVESVVDYLHRTGDISEVVTIAGTYRRSDGPSTNSANKDSKSD